MPGAPASDCLFNFLKLTDSDDPEDFARYAAVHGVLGLTEHGLPATFAEKDPPLVPGDPLWHFELVSLWRAYAQNAKMLLVLTMALRQNERIDPIEVLGNAGVEPKDLRFGGQIPPPARFFELDERDYYRVSGGAWPEEKDHPFFIPVPWLTDITFIYTGKDVESQRRALMLWLEHHWLGLANIAPAVEWSSEPARLVLKLGHRPLKIEASGDTQEFFHWPANTLFSVLAAELTGIICSDRYVAQCHRCLALHPSRIKVRTDQPNYCDSCRLEVRRATNRNAARKRYARQKAERTCN
jgi:hypothetical protein